jgi:hypothetical protein
MSKKAEGFLESCMQIETALSQIYGLAITIENGSLMNGDMFKTRNEEEGDISSPLYSMAGIIKEKVEFCIKQIGCLEVPDMP